MKYILNADDFGQTYSVNRAITECFDEGTVTRTSVMVNMPPYEEAKRLARENGFYDKIGLHINLLKGVPLTKEILGVPSFSDGKEFNAQIFKKRRLLFFLTPRERRAVRCEVEAQIERYISDGFPLMHADSHGHVHTFPSLRRLVMKALKKHGFVSTRISRNLAVRSSGLRHIFKSHTNKKIRKTFRSTEYFGSLGDAFSDFSLHTDEDGVTEIMLHPNYYEDGFAYGEGETYVLSDFPDEIMKNRI